MAHGPVKVNRLEIGRKRALGQIRTVGQAFGL
jgi:hypothetical protein